MHVCTCSLALCHQVSHWQTPVCLTGWKRRIKERLLCPCVQGDHISKAIKDPLGRGTAICSNFYNAIFSANFLPVLLLLRLCRPEVLLSEAGTVFAGEAVGILWLCRVFWERSDCFALLHSFPSSLMTEQMKRYLWTEVLPRGSSSFEPAAHWKPCGVFWSLSGWTGILMGLSSPHVPVTALWLCGHKNVRKDFQYPPRDFQYPWHRGLGWL